MRDVLFSCRAASAFFLLAFAGCASSPAATAAEDLCAKLASCGDPGDVGQCEQQGETVLQFVVDPAGFASCITKKSCDALKNETQSTVEACVDVDPDSFKCSGETLHYCNNDGKCTTLDCNDLCATVTARFSSCVEEDGRPQCGCAL